MTTEGNDMPDGVSTENTGTSAQGGDTPGTGNVSDGTSTVAATTASTVSDSNSVSTPAATRSDDTRGNGYDLSKLLDNLDSLPERVANAVREAAAPATQTTASTPDNSTVSAGSGTQVSETGNSGEATARSRSERFAGWWFGK